MRPPRPQDTLPVSLVRIVERSGATLDPGRTDPATVQVRGITHDSRAVHPDDVYAALAGQHHHGAAFASQALAAGAVAVLTDLAGRAVVREHNRDVPILAVERPRRVLGRVAALVYGEPAARLATIGVTGTNGKTTTAYLIDAALRALGTRTGLIGTVETRIGEERLRSARTTPESPDLHAILAVMVERGTETVVMEVSSHALVQGRVDGVVFDVALFTNLSQDHLDFHESMPDYFAAKASLFTGQRSRRGVVCVDDEWGVRLAAQAGIPLVTVSSRPGTAADWHVTAGQWPTFTLTGPREQLSLRCHLPGTFNLVNTAMAALALLEAGYAVPTVTAALAAEPVVPGRMERVPSGSHDPRCIVDYAHTPDAVDAALAALRPSTPGRLVVVLGAGGDRDRGKRRAMGEAAGRWADDLVLTDDNPRSEDPATIRAELLAGAGATLRGQAHPSAGSRASDIAHAVELARERGQAGDNTVVVLGKGHETGQQIGEAVHPFDDRDALVAALRGEPYRPSDPDPGGHR
ncbi:MAG: UDP-N-acetylmuramoyl-L-alanyl-D-glutamate--2,6-diaminopimelate ligase [Dermatophilaceae bacterium]